MLTKVEAYTDQGAVLELPMQDPIDGYVVRPIDGLGPTKATIVTSTFALLDGAQYQTSRREPRNIVLKLGLRPNLAYPTVQILRNRLYGWFMPKARVTLRFYTLGLPPVDIVGYVETCEPSIFSADPEMTISIINTNPDFNSLDEITFNAYTTPDPDVESVVYYGSVETGFLFSMELDRDLGGFTINHSLSSGLGQSLVFNGDVVTGDLVEISTLNRQKGAWVTHDGVRTSVLKMISPSSDWVDLYPGENSLRVYAEGAGIPYSIEYREKFGGL